MGSVRGERLSGNNGFWSFREISEAGYRYGSDECCGENRCGVRRHGYTVLNLVEIRKPHKDEKLTQTFRVGERIFDY